MKKQHILNILKKLMPLSKNLNKFYLSKTMIKSYQLIRDYPNSDIKAGGIYTLVNGSYVDDFGNAFPAQAVETNPDYFREIPQAAPQPTQEALPAPVKQVAEVLQGELNPDPTVPQQPVQPLPPVPQMQPQQQPMPPMQPMPQPQMQAWVPTPGDNFFSVNGDGELRYLMWQNKPEYYKILEFGNVFRTQVEASMALQEMKKIFQKIRSNAGVPVAQPMPQQPYYPPQQPAYSPQPQYYPPQPYYPPQQGYYPPAPQQQPAMPGDYLHAQPDQPAQPPAAFIDPNVHAQQFRQP